jgi:hypothetical protein
MKFRLLQPHFVTNKLGTAYLAEAGTVLDSDEMPRHWEPTPLMEGLDDQAKAAVRALCDKIRKANEHPEGLHGAGHVPGIPVSMDHMPGGSHYVENTVTEADTPAAEGETNG